MDTIPPIIADASPLIGLDRIGQVDLLRRLYATILVPPAVAREIGPTLAVLPWVEEVVLTRPLDSRIVLASLGDGESEAIGLAMETDARQIVLDDGPGRRLARRLSMPVIGTGGLLRTAKERGLVPAIGPILDALIATDFRISADVCRSLLVAVGELPQGG